MSFSGMENLPEPVRNLFQNIDPAALAQMAAAMDPQMVLGFLNNALGTFRQSMKPEEAAAFEQVLETLMKAMGEQRK